MCMQASPSSDAAGLPHAEIDALTKRTQDGGIEVVQAKAGKVVLPARPSGHNLRVLDEM